MQHVGIAMPLSFDRHAVGGLSTSLAGARLGVFMWLYYSVVLLLQLILVVVVDAAQGSVSKVVTVPYVAPRR